VNQNDKDDTINTIPKTKWGKGMTTRWYIGIDYAGDAVFCIETTR
jgi:hypothetical protein